MIKRATGEIINLQSKEPFCAVKSATQNSSLMGDDYIQLSVVSSYPIKFEKGDKIVVDGYEYSIRTTATAEIISDNYYTYEPIFYGVMYELMKTLYRNCDEDGKSDKSDFSLTYSIREFVKVIINNLNRDYPGYWAFDEENCPDTEPITIQFTRQNCLQVLQTLCTDDNFKLEFLITQEDNVRTIHIGKFGEKINSPGGAEYFEWGKGKGLYKLKEEKIDDKAIITRFWAEGGTNNIRSNYRDYAERVQLPLKRLNKNQHTLDDGTIIEAESEMIGIEDDAKRYIEDAELRDAIGSEEDADVYDNIYPTRPGEVTAIVEDDINCFIDDTMDFDLCAKDDDGNTLYLIDSTAAKITFIDGKLAGQEFELAESGGYNHEKKMFKLVATTDNRGLTIPTTDTEAYRIEKGNHYKITDINLPESYEADAEEELWYRAYQDFKPRTQARAQYSLTLDRKYLLDNVARDSDTVIFHVGDYVPIKDERFGIEKNIRITKIVRNLLLEQDYTLTLADSVSVSILTQTVTTVINQGITIDQMANDRIRDLIKMRRGWRMTEELRDMVYDTDGYFDTDNIRPNSIDTNMLTVGSQSQQFVLTGCVLQANVNGDANIFTAGAGTLTHLVITRNGGLASWTLNSRTFSSLKTGGYYLFARCSKTTNVAEWILTQERLTFEITGDADFYYLQIGILSSVYSDDNFRDFQTTYGFTRINGNTITTGKIITSDKECYLDLDGNQFRIGDSSSSIDWNVTKKNQLTLKNVTLLSGSGDSSVIGVFRGEYNADYVYYYGDEVSYTNNGSTATYRYVNSEPSKGNLPTNSTYWNVVAQGKDGVNGEDGSPGIPGVPGSNGETSYFHIRYSDVANPTKSSQMTTTPSTYIGTYVDFTKEDSTDPSKYTWSRFEGAQGETGEQGIPGTNGEDGKTSYLHIKYSNDGGATFTANNGETAGDWIGYYVDFNEIDSSDPTDYSWSKIKGDKGDYYKPYYRYAIDQPDEPTTNTPPPSGWSDSPDKEDIAFTHGEIFTEVDGYYVSPEIAHGEITKNRISFTTTKANQTVAIELIVSSEVNYDYALVGLLDNENLSRTGNYTDRISGDTSKIIYVDVPTAGTHFIDIAYAKDGTVVKGDDNAKYRVLNVTNCWLTMAYINGATGLALGWTTPKLFFNDSNDVERIYLLTDSTTVPDVPYSDPYTDDYVPPRTFNDYSSDTSYAVDDLVRYSGKYYKCIAANSSTDAHAPGDTDYWSAINTWTDNPSGTSNAWQYEYEAIRYKTNGKWGEFQTPTLWNKYANSADFYEYRYAVNGSTTTPPKIYNNMRYAGFALASITGGDVSYTWNTVMPTVGTLQYLWETVALIDGETNKLKTNWSTPIRRTPYDGTDGANGSDGADGKDGSSPVCVFRGVYDSSKTYYGNSNRLDCVKYNGVYYIARIDADETANANNTVFSGIIPTNTEYWNTFGAQFDTVATQLLLAEFANIGNWVIRQGSIISTDGILNNASSTQYTEDDFIPAVMLDSENGQIKLGATLMLDKYSLNLLDDNEYSKLKVTRGTIGTYDADLFKASYSESAQLHSETSSQYIASSDSNWWANLGVIQTFKLGYFERGSKINIGTVKFNFTVPYMNDGTTVVNGKYAQPTFTVTLYQNNSVYKTFAYSTGGTFSSGKEINLEIDCNFALEITKALEGDYRIVVSVPGIYIQCTTKSGSTATFAKKLTMTYSYTRSNYQRTLIAQDGLMSCFGSGLLFFSKDAFVVRQGAYLLRMTSEKGLQKSTDSGATWTTI